MKILFIFTGGTIGSTADGKIIFVDDKKPYLLLEKYNSMYNIDFQYATAEPYSALSENNTGNELKALCDCVKENLSKDYDGIVITHGTDTLQYSAAALSYTLGKCPIPVCLVSSNFIIEDSRSNAIANLHGAIEFIKNFGEKGVWVPYQNTGDTVKIHRASRLLASNAFSDGVASIFGCHYGSFDKNMCFTKNPAYTESCDEIPPLSTDMLGEECDCILRLDPYVGMTYPEIKDSIKYILLGSYHSGTINTTSASARRFYETAHSKGVKVFLTGAYSTKSYESTKSFAELHINPIMKLSPISAYVKLWLCSNNDNVTEIMNAPLGGDK